MASARTGRGDPAKTLQLLWRAPSGEPRRGPKPSVSVDRVVETATELADRHGLAAVTIRRVAERIGVSTMSVYTYVPGKPELLDLMLDHAYLTMPRARWRTRSWRRRLERVAKDNVELFARHPWAASMASCGRGTRT